MSLSGTSFANEVSSTEECKVGSTIKFLAAHHDTGDEHPWVEILGRDYINGSKVINTFEVLTLSCESNTKGTYIFRDSTSSLYIGVDKSEGLPYKRVMVEPGDERIAMFTLSYTLDSPDLKEIESINTVSNPDVNLTAMIAVEEDGNGIYAFVDWFSKEEQYYTDSEGVAFTFVETLGFSENLVFERLYYPGSNTFLMANPAQDKLGQLRYADRSDYYGGPHGLSINGYNEFYWLMGHKGIYEYCEPDLGDASVIYCNKKSASNDSLYSLTINGDLFTLRSKKTNKTLADRSQCRKNHCVTAAAADISHTFWIQKKQGDKAFILVDD